MSLLVVIEHRPSAPQGSLGSQEAAAVVDLLEAWGLV
jgi:hypothetical protein